MKNPIREKLSKGKVSIGSWLNLGSPLAGEVMADAGFEWLTVDAEHTAYDMALIADTFRGIDSRGAVSFVRAWDHDPVTLARLLDAGAYGIVIPHVSTAKQAETIVSAMRYPPVGIRSSGTGRIATFGSDYKSTANDEILVMPQIEDMEGINNAEAIMSVEGVGVGFLGPGDLSLSMGLEPGHPDHETAIQKFLAACKKVGKPAGIPTTFEAAQQRIDEGFLMIDVSNELAILSGAARKMVEALH